MALKRSTIRLVAVLFILMSGVELVACGLTERSRASHITSVTHEQSDEACGCDDGCLCCCSHVLPVAVFSVPAVKIAKDKILFAQPGAPDSSLVRLYRPPRT